MAKANRSERSELGAALRHPLRRQILRAMAGGEAVSPAQLAATLRAPLSRITYHLSVLAGCAAVNLVSTGGVGGAEHRLYSTTAEGPGAAEVPGLGERGENSEGAGT